MALRARGTSRSPFHLGSVHSKGNITRPLSAVRDLCRLGGVPSTPLRPWTRDAPRRRRDPARVQGKFRWQGSWFLLEGREEGFSVQEEADEVFPFPGHTAGPSSALGIRVALGDGVPTGPLPCGTVPPQWGLYLPYSCRVHPGGRSHLGAAGAGLRTVRGAEDSCPRGIFSVLLGSVPRAPGNPVQPEHRTDHVFRGHLAVLCVSSWAQPSLMSLLS